MNYDNMTNNEASLVLLEKAKKIIESDCSDSKKCEWLRQYYKANGIKIFKKEVTFGEGDGLPTIGKNIFFDKVKYKIAFWESDTRDVGLYHDDYYLYLVKE